MLPQIGLGRGSDEVLLRCRRMLWVQVPYQRVHSFWHSNESVTFGVAVKNYIDTAPSMDRFGERRLA